MLRLDKVIKPWKESAALNDHINLYGFWNETAFLTKSGDVGMVLRVPGVDYESLDHAEQEYAVKRLEAALKAFGPGFHVYQYLFKSNRPEIPFASYDDPVVEAAIDQRRKFFEANAIISTRSKSSTPSFLKAHARRAVSAQPSPGSSAIQPGPLLS
jgi:type IV secretion system protein VirB4